MERYKKGYQVLSAIAREMTVLQPGDRITTIQEYTEQLSSSRGMVQNALNILEQNGAITLEKHGKSGTVLAAHDIPLLFEHAGLKFITGSMPVPLSFHLAGLATGVCVSMKQCPAAFTFAFVQGAGNRVEALERGIYDFAVLSMASAQVHCAENKELQIATVLQGAEYSPPFRLYLQHGLHGIQDGCRIAVDPSCTDQYALTKLCSEHNRVELVFMPYIATRAAFLAGDVDCLVFRAEDWTGKEHFDSQPFTQAQVDAHILPAVVTHRKNYFMAEMLQQYLNPSIIVENQRAVILREKEPQFY